jgi:NAD-dependent SIR2 family protein deacetylase
MRAIDAQFSTARPGRRDEALAGLHRAGKVAAVITRTSDTVHQAAGIPDPAVVTLHSNTTLRNLARKRPLRRARLGARAVRGRHPVAGP